MELFLKLPWLKADFFFQPSSTLAYVVLPCMPTSSPPFSPHSPSSRLPWNACKNFKNFHSKCPAPSQHHWEYIPAPTSGTYLFSKITWQEQASPQVTIQTTLSLSLLACMPCGEEVIFLAAFVGSTSFSFFFILPSETNPSQTLVSGSHDSPHRQNRSWHLDKRDWLSSCRTSDTQPPEMVSNTTSRPNTQFIWPLPLLCNRQQCLPVKHPQSNSSGLWPTALPSIILTTSLRSNKSIIPGFASRTLLPAAVTHHESSHSFQTLESLGPVISLCKIPKWSASARLWAK